MGFFDNFFKSSAGNGINDIMKGTNTSRDRANVLGFNEEFAKEFSPDIDNSDSDNSYSQNGVKLEDGSSTFRLVYNGILAKDGAQHIYSVIGYGNNLRWEDVEYHKMHKVDDHTFEALIPINKSGNINIAFKDCANHWDNNSGMNYCFMDHFNEGSL